ncbi:MULTISPECIES: (R)-mandelonitrile lyase [Sphingobacterium]|jgi:quercetin dioxygenase-like cupin family protein|uniref:(R)-mandelonitrile lyase n=1 Tax=Sphingobacterium TaxID=28453 RepID=UPI000389E75C|nr:MULTISPECIES: cupin domain-containing protein [Sphingobacterium]KKX47574.1 cupin [Sphingobacterium sp. IITKGP-BTPF85]MCW2259022.1 quercetin dioxygenase-like cupin family protein [Sphingobacterium kitahiroshimense]TCR14525.1 quercetin dioxygenase-like cupin family protein [Sphingobacterium sp. JUb78]
MEQIINEIFEKGNQITNGYFTGNAFLNLLQEKDENNDFALGNVTFESGARTNWHTHPRGQVLIITDGTGIYQERGQVAQLIKKGDIINIPEDVEHWHGASAVSGMIHIAITNYKDEENVTWLQAVSEEEYAIANKQIQR